MSSEFDEKAAQLAQLSREERWAKLLEFPTSYLFKIFGDAADFGNHVRHALDQLGYSQVIFTERQSQHGKFIALTFSLKVNDVQGLERAFCAMEKIPGIRFIL